MAELLLFLFLVITISVLIDGCVQLWQESPLTEEKSTPVYITKEIWED